MAKTKPNYGVAIMGYYCLLSVTPELLCKFRQEKKRRNRHYTGPSQSAHLNRMTWIFQGQDRPLHSCQGCPSPSSPCTGAEPVSFHLLSHCACKSHVNAEDPCFLLVFECQAVQQLNHKQLSHAWVELTSAGQGSTRALNQGFDELSNKDKLCTDFLRSSFSFFLLFRENVIQYTVIQYNFQHKQNTIFKENQ